jgi:hypothetical protein
MRPGTRNQIFRKPMGSYTSGSEFALSDPALERHYSVIEVAKLWGLSENTIRRMFTGEPGVVEWGGEESRFKRAYKTMRIPESVVQRVHRRLAKTG